MTTAATSFQTWINVGLGFLYPEICQLCGEQRATAKEGYVCGRCWSHVRFIKPPFCERCGLPFEGDLTTPFECANCREMELHFSAARSAVVARGAVREIIHRYKYQRALWFEPFLAGLLLREAVPALRGQNWDLIVPVPLHPLEAARTGIQPGRTPGRSPRRRRKHPGEQKTAPACRIHQHPDAADAATARGEHARRICDARRRAAGRGAGDSGG